MLSQRGQRDCQRVIDGDSRSVRGLKDADTIGGPDQIDAVENIEQRSIGELTKTGDENPERAQIELPYFRKLRLFANPPRSPLLNRPSK